MTSKRGGKSVERVAADANVILSVPQATRLIGEPDPDEAGLLALALALLVPIWTNDRDFETTGVECYTTAKVPSNTVTLALR